MFGYQAGMTGVMTTGKMASIGVLMAVALLACLVTVNDAVKITNLKVPSVYVLGHPDNAEHLVLDCEYQVGMDEEEGFVLKWWLNEQPIYQWIGKNHQPHAMPSPMRSYINVNYTASTQPLHKYRALAIAKPSVNMTGTYTCHVSTFKSEDKRSATLQIIHPESRISVDLKESKRDPETLQVRCNAADVFPEPKMAVFIGDTEQIEFTTDSKKDAADGLYDVAVYGTVPKSYVTDPTSVDCIMTIPGTNYTARTEAYDISSSSNPTLSTMAAVATLIVSVALRV